jgi:mitogen-activated protein kinase kinase
MPSTNCAYSALDRISRDFGPVRVDVLGKIAEATLGGLTYLYTKHHIMHRDIKPSNILVNSRGFIKLCDFGVSGELVNSVADTFVGTSTYMAPERIQGEKYTVKSDVWSFGLTIMELAIGKFPFDASDQLSDSDGAPAGILDLLQQIVHEPAPKLPKSDAFPQILEDMIQKCMAKEPAQRPTPQELYVSACAFSKIASLTQTQEREPFVQAAKRTPVNLQEWAINLMERHNRKSHLAPQLSPATQALLRGADSPSETSSGDIIIGGSNLTSPRDQFINSINSSRSPQVLNSSARSGMSRSTTTGSITMSASSTVSGYENGSSNSGYTPTHILPMRPAPTGQLPPPPPRKDRQIPYGAERY